MKTFSRPFQLNTSFPKLVDTSPAKQSMAACLKDERRFVDEACLAPSTWLFMVNNEMFHNLWLQRAKKLLFFLFHF